MNGNEKFLVLVIALIGALTLFITLPVLQYVLLSIILAYVLYPVHVRLRRHVGSFLSAIFLIAASIVSVIAPVAYILYVFAQDLREVQSGETGLEIPVVEDRIFELTGVEVDILSTVETATEGIFDILFGGVTGVISTALQFFIGIALVLFLVFYLLRDGENFVVWVEELSPLPKRDTKHLFRKVNQTMWGSVIGHTFAALVQAVVAGIGIWLVGIPNPLFWTVVMAILAFLPLIGAFLVWAPAAAYLVIIDEMVPGVLLFIYGLTIVSMIDYYARPLVIDQSARLNPGVILVGVFGGLYTFGFVGLFVGPIVIGILAATLETMKDKQDTERAEDGAKERLPTEYPYTSEVHESADVPDGAIDGTRTDS